MHGPPVLLKLHACLFLIVQFVPFPYRSAGSPKAINLKLFHLASIIFLGQEQDSDRPSPTSLYLIEQGNISESSILPQAAHQLGTKHSNIRK